MAQPHTDIRLRDYRADEQSLVDALVRAAWQELARDMPDWPALATRLGALTEKADDSEVILAERDGIIVGAVGYVGAHQSKPGFFDPDWPAVRLLSVAPGHRGLGIGQRLLEACIDRARRDQASTLALHTTPVMTHAQRLYRRLGFEWHRPLPTMYGVPYAVWVRTITHPSP